MENDEMSCKLMLLQTNVFHAKKKYCKFILVEKDVLVMKNAVEKCFFVKNDVENIGATHYPP